MLFPSTLVISSKLSDIDPLLAELGHEGIENNPDIFLVDEYTVENIRQIKKFLSHKPYSHLSKIIVIPQAELLNLESQNTLLKNLEEPGEGNYFILISDKPNSLISTILSRCHKIRHVSDVNTESIINFPQSIKESLELTDSMPKDKISVLSFLENQIKAYQNKLVENPQNANIIKRLIKANQMINANIDPKNVLDFLFLNN